MKIVRYDVSPADTV